MFVSSFVAIYFCIINKIYMYFYIFVSIRKSAVNILLYIPIIYLNSVKVVQLSQNLSNYHIFRHLFIAYIAKTQ